MPRSRARWVVQAKGDMGERAMTDQPPEDLSAIVALVLAGVVLGIVLVCAVLVITS